MEKLLRNTRLRIALAISLFTLFLVACGGGGGDNSGGDTDVPAPVTLNDTSHSINDTGISTWGDANNSALSASPTGFPFQDADVGRDARARAGNLVKVGAGSAGFDFTKLDARGNPLVSSALYWSCVRDNVTGLIWEIKTNDGWLQDQNNTYSWYNPDPATNGGATGSRNGGACSGGINCDTAGYVTAVNAAGLCGASDWRLPTREELISIVDYGKPYPGPTIDSNYFSATPSSFFWSSSTSARYNSEYAWLVNFANGITDQSQKGYTVFATEYYVFRVRLVRGG